MEFFTEIDVHQATLKNAMAYVVRAVDRHSSRYALEGVLLHRSDDGAIRLVATDSRRAHDAELPGALFKGDPLNRPGFSAGNGRLPILPLKVCREIATLPTSEGVTKRPRVTIKIGATGYKVNASRGPGSKWHMWGHGGSLLEGRFPMVDYVLWHDNIKSTGSIEGPTGHVRDLFQPITGLRVAFGPSGPVSIGQEFKHDYNQLKRTGEASVNVTPEYVTDAMPPNDSVRMDFTGPYGPLHVRSGIYHAIVMPRNPEPIGACA